jgi:hypothetical protein
MVEAKVGEGLKLKPIWCLYCPQIIYLIEENVISLSVMTVSRRQLILWPNTLQGRWKKQKQ